MATARLAVLALFVVGCQCGGIPAIPAGRRAQYYTQQSDGAYQYGYDTAEGLFQVQQADNANEVQGFFGAEGGETKYTAGVGGFVVTDHKKASASAGYAATKASAPVRYATAEELNTHPKQVEDTPEVAAAKAKFAADYAAAAAAAEAAPDVDIITGAEPIEVEVAPHFDDGVRYSGPYATINAEGQVEETAEVRALKAKFAADYAAAAAAAEAAPDVNIISAPAPAAVYSAPVSAPSALYGAPSAYQAPAPKSFEIASVRSTANDDGSYEFSYETSDSSRHESADAANNVNGNFEFVADDAQRRRVDYSAGAETGFIASGAHLPVSVSDTAEVAAAKASFKSAFESAAAAAAASPDSTEYQAPAAVAVKAASPALIITQVQAAKPIRYATLEELSTLPKPVVDTPEVAAAKVSFQAAYDAHAALAEAAPDVDIITGPAPAVLYSAPAPPVALYEAPAAAVKFTPAVVSLDAEGNLQDTPEVAAAKAAFHKTYAAQAAAAEAAPDVNIITGPAPAAVYTAPAQPAALYQAPAVSVKFAPAVVSLDAEGNLQDTPEVAAAKAAFHKTYAAQAAAAEAAPDVNIITGTAPAAAAVSYSAPAPAVSYGAPAVAKASYPAATKSAAHHGAMRTHVFDGITLMVTESGLSPSKFGYGYE